VETGWRGGGKKGVKTSSPMRGKEGRDSLRLGETLEERKKGEGSSFSISPL